MRNDLSYTACDPLDAARGIFWGAVAGLAIWAMIAGLIWYVVTHG